MTTYLHPQPEVAVIAEALCQLGLTDMPYLNAWCIRRALADAGLIVPPGTPRIIDTVVFS